MASELRKRETGQQSSLSISPSNRDVNQYLMIQFLTCLRMEPVSGVRNHAWRQWTNFWEWRTIVTRGLGIRLIYQPSDSSRSWAMTTLSRPRNCDATNTVIQAVYPKSNGKIR